MADWPLLTWTENGVAHSAPLVSARPMKAPRQVEAVDLPVPTGRAHGLLAQGTALLWRGDYPAARKLLEALGRHGSKARPAATPADAFHAYRMHNAQRSQLLGLLLVPIADGSIALPRAQSASVALAEAFGALPSAAVMPLRDILAAISAHEWRKNGVAINALDGARIHPHFGVFPPTRQDYIDLVGAAPLPPVETAFDLGTGSGVLAAVLLHRGVPSVVATDNAPRAIVCAQENLSRLGFAGRAEIVPGDLYPEGRAGLIVCNPPWLPAKSATDLESAVYDPQSRMLRAFLSGAAARLAPGGEAWLVMSDLAERLGLRAPGELAALIAAAGLVVLGRLDTAPSPKGAQIPSDPLFAARSAEVVSLWRLGTSQAERP